VSSPIEENVEYAFIVALCLNSIQSMKGSLIMPHLRITHSVLDRRPVGIACLALLPLALAVGCSGRGDSSASSFSAALTSPPTALMKPSGGLGHYDTNTVGCPFDDEWTCVSDGTSLAANDPDKYVYSTAAGGKQGQSYSGAPAGSVTAVTTNVVAGAQSGASGTVTVTVYDGSKLIETGAAHTLTTSYAVYSDSFDVSVTNANSLRTWVTFSSADLKFSEIWLAATVVSTVDAGSGSDHDANSASDASRGDSATTGGDSGGSSLGSPPAIVTLQPIDGGPNYYCSHNFTQACNHGWDSPTFFPIGPFWANYAGEQSTWSSVGWNTEFYTTSQTDVDDLATDGRYSIPAASVTPNANTVGFDAADEPGSWSAGTAALTSTASSSQDSRFWYVNNTWNMAEYGPPSGTPGNTQSSFFSDLVTTLGGTQRHFDIGSIDLYWFALATTGVTYNSLNEGGDLYNNGGALTAAEAKCGCRYGDMLRNVFGTTVGLPSGKSQAAWQTTYPAPLFQYIEDGDAFVTLSPNEITPPELNWAVWSTIIHGGRGIIYFDHGGCPAGSQNSDNFILTTCATTVQSGQTVSIQTQMQTTDNEVETLAPEINSPTALGYETVSPAPTTFGGIETRAVWDTNSTDCNGKAPCFFIFADTREAETAANIGATFTTAGHYSGSVPVVNESRSVTATSGAFNDTFAHGSTVHIYGPIPNQ
jgi:hypothetical protein